VTTPHWEWIFRNRSQHRQLRWPSGPIAVAGGLLDPWGIDLGDADAGDVAFELQAVSSEAGAIELINRGRPLQAEGGKRIYSGESRRLTLPARFWGGGTQFEAIGAEDSLLDRIATALPAADGRIGSGSMALPELGIAPGASTLAHWFDALGELQRLSTASARFHQACCDALIDPGGLDAAMILERRGDDWELVASRIEVPELGIGFLRDWIERAATTGQVHFADPKKIAAFERRDGERAVIAAPYWDASRRVRGVVWGSRSQHRNNARRGIRPLEAQFVGLVADALTAGTVRIEHETDSVRRQVLLEQAFPPAVARRLTDDPGILQARRGEITILFVDLRDSTRLTQSLAPERLYGLLSETMNAWTRAVIESGGAVLDYFGDGLAAFWNAPVEQPGHAQAACLAGMAILERLPELRARWESELPEPLRLGIGVHTGEAVVGNAGTERRIKYGPRGEAIHVACRIESATKPIGVPLLISAATAATLDERMTVRRVGRIRLPGVAEAMELFEPLAFGPNAGARELARRYGEALDAYESGNWASAWTSLRQLAVDHPHDGAVRWLADRIERIQSGTIDRRSGDARAPYVPLTLDALLPGPPQATATRDA